MRKQSPLGAWEQFLACRRSSAPRCESGAPASPRAVVQLLNGDVLASPLAGGIRGARRSAADALDVHPYLVRLAVGDNPDLSDSDDISDVLCKGPLVAIAMPDPMERIVAEALGLESIAHVAGQAGDKLDLRCQDLRRLPTTFGRLLASKAAPLREVDVSANELEFIPNNLCSLPALERLDVGTNHLRCLPACLGDLSTLKELDAASNKLRSVPDSLGLLAELQALDLRENFLQALPNSLGRCSSLLTLSLDGNELRSLPDSLCDLSHLESLSVGGNRLTQLPESFSRLRSLRRLLVFSNRLAELPGGLDSLKELLLLDLKFNCLLDLPEAIGRLNPLVEIHLAGNFQEPTPRLLQLQNEGMHIRL